MSARVPTADGRRVRTRRAGGGSRRTPSLGPPPAEMGLLGRVVRLNLAVTQVLDEITNAAGVSVADYLVLGVVRTSPGSRATPTQICAMLGRTSGGMTLTLDRLQAAGWLRRTHDDADRRRVHVELTPEGLRLAKAVNDALHRWEASLELDPTRRGDVDAALADLLTAIERSPTPEL